MIEIERHFQGEDYRLGRVRKSAPTAMAPVSSVRTLQLDESAIDRAIRYATIRLGLITQQSSCAVKRL